MSQGGKGKPRFDVTYTYETRGAGNTVSHKATVVLVAPGESERNFTSEWFPKRTTAAQDAAAIAFRFCEEYQYPAQSQL